jgi:hypothetical protein
MHTILSLDPGVTTGYCLAKLNGRKLSIDVGQADWTLAQMFQRVREVAITRNSHIIYETFEYRNAARMGLNLTPVKMIGVIEVFKEWYEPLCGFWPQSAAQGKGFYSDEKLKELGVYVKGKKHGRDATRHLLQWLTFGAGSQYVNIDEAVMELT